MIVEYILIMSRSFYLIRFPALIIAATIISFFSLPVHAVEKKPPSEATCVSKPPEERVTALGFELGMCREEIKDRIKVLEKEIRRKVLTSESKELKCCILIDYVILKPVQTPDLNEYTSLKFTNDLLISVHSNYVYSKFENAVKAFGTLENSLNKKYGKTVKFNRHLQRKWETKTYSVGILLERSGRLPVTLRLSYELTQSSQRQTSGKGIEHTLQ